MSDKTYDKFCTTFKKSSYKLFKFKNKHGERFYLILPVGLPALTLITGDEYDWVMTPLFNPKFDIYSDAELVNIGKGLVALNEHN